MRPVLLVLTGPVGVGKSTVCGLLAERFERTVSLSADEFAGFITHGFVDQWRLEAAQQNEVLGAVLAVAAMRFLEGRYTVLLDGHFP